MADGKVIDAHMHVWAAEWLPEGLRWAWARQGSGRRLPERDPAEIFPRVAQRQSDPEATATIAAFDFAGVAAGIIPVVDWTIVGQPAGEHLPIGELNRKYEELASRHDSRLFFAAGLDPRHADAPQLLQDALAQPHCRGIKLYPAAGWDLDDPEFAWLFQELLDHDVPVVIHTSPLGGDPLQVERSRPSRIGALMAAYPRLRVSFAHAGIEAWWAEALDCATGWQHAYLEISLWQSVAARDYAEFRARIARMVAQIGAHRVVFGSDIVRGQGRDPEGKELLAWVEQVRGLAQPYQGSAPVISPEQLELILAENAIRLFGLKEHS